MDIARLISKRNKKMNCWSWSISTKSCTNKAGIICQKCYAKRGNYLFKPVFACLEERFDWWETTGFKKKTDTFIFLLNHYEGKFFRVFESGDFNSIESIKAWIRICSNVTKLKFWIPTKTWQSTKFIPHLIKLNALKNVAVRPSGTDVDVPAPVIKGLSSGLAIFKNKKLARHKVCSEKCENCRICWHKKTKIMYKLR